MTYTARSHQTSTMRTVDTAENMGLDDSDGQNWYTSCDDHGSILSSETRELAMAAQTADFCEGCAWITRPDSLSEYEAMMSERAYGRRVRSGDVYMGAGNTIAWFDKLGRHEANAVSSTDGIGRVEVAVYADNGSRTFQWVPTHYIREVNGQPITIVK